MEWASFHHPDWSLPVVRRRLTVELLDTLDLLGKTLVTRGRNLTWNRSYPSRTAYKAAMYRLRRRGLIAYRREGGKPPVLCLTSAGESSLPRAFRPHRFWNRRWKGIWYMLVYDVPESSRAYRNTLRAFLKRLRMGYLQDSVWISANDVRPEFSDLVEAGAAGDYAFLFEARTVLGLRPQEVVRSAWDMDRLQDIQAWYCKVCSDNTRRLIAGDVSARELTDLAREATTTYLAVMENDPLLPRALWPSGYLGEEAHRLHRELATRIARQL